LEGYKSIDNQLEKSAGTRRHYVFYFHNDEKLTIMQSGLFTHEITSKIIGRQKIGILILMKTVISFLKYYFLFVMTLIKLTVPVPSHIHYSIITNSILL